MSTNIITRPPFSATAPHKALAFKFEALLCGARNHAETEEGYACASDTLKALATYQRELMHLIEMGTPRDTVISLLRQEAYAAQCEADECQAEVEEIREAQEAHFATQENNPF